MFEGLNCDALTQWHWSAVFSWFNSSFTSALAGAFAGAVAASSLQSRKETKRQLIDQLNACNACASYSNAVFIAALGFKEQLSKPLVDQYYNDRERFINHMKNNAIEGKPFHVEFNFGSINMFQHAAETIVESIAFKSGASAKTVLAASFLRQCLHALEQALIWQDQSKQHISSLKGEFDDVHLAHLYFGLPIEEQLEDARLLHAIDAISSQTDGVIFYSRYVANKLSERASELSKHIGKGAPPPFEMKMDMEKIGNLLPDPEEFPDWQD